MKYWNTLLYGSKKAKRYLLTIIAFFCLFVALTVCSLLMPSAALGGAAFLVLIIDILFASSISWKDLERQEGQGDQDGQEKRHSGKSIGEKNREKHQRRDLAQEEDSGQEDISGQKDGFGQREDSRQKDSERTEPSVKLYRGNNVKKLLHRYKVNRKHKVVLVDSYPKCHIKQCPAYIWVEKKKLWFLFLTEEPLKIDMPLKEVTSVSYVPAVEAKPLEDYRDVLQSELLKFIFSPYLPTQYSLNKNGHSAMCKNLYELPNGIRLTNLSAKQFFSLVQAKLEIRDDFSRSQKIDAYSKEAYHYCVLWKDGILDTQEYKNEINRILKSMMETGMPQATFEHNIRNMVQRRFITKEFADYYTKRYSADMHKRI